MYRQIPIVLPGVSDSGPISPALPYLYFFSFAPDVHMVVDCSVIVTVQPTNGTADDKVEELLFPDRHNVTLPLNGLNILFNTCETAFNHTTQIAPDRCEYNNVFILGAGITSITCFLSAIFFSTLMGGPIFQRSNRILILPPPM